MKKTYTELVEDISVQEIEELYEYAVLKEKNMKKDEVAQLIDDAISAVIKVKNDPKKSDKHKTTAISVLKTIRGIKKTFEKEGSIHPNALNSVMRVVAGVNSGRYGYMNKNSPKVPQNYAKEEDEVLQEGMTSRIAKVTAIGLKRKVVSIGNQVESATDIGEKINHLSKQLNAVAGIALVAVSMSDEGLLSKGVILTSLLSSYEPDENLDALFEEGL